MPGEMLVVVVAGAVLLAVVGALWYAWRGRSPASTDDGGFSFSGRSVVGVVRPPAEHFTNRTPQVAQLKQWLLSQNREAIICGMGGVGKSTLASQVAAELKEEYPLQLLIELRQRESSTGHAIEQSTTEALTAAIYRLVALQGGIMQPQNLPADEGELAGVYFSLLSDTRQPVLVVLEDPQTLPQMRRFSTPNHCALLATTRLQFAHNRRIDLTELAAEDATALLQKHAPATPTDAATTIARLCGSLPLALDMAGRHLASPDAPDAAAYARELEQELQRVRRQAARQGVRHEVEAALTLSYRLLNDKERQCLHGLAILPAPFSRAMALWLIRELATTPPPPADNTAANPAADPAADLEDAIRTAYHVLQESEEQASRSDRPKEQARLRADAAAQRQVLAEQLPRYLHLCRQHATPPAEDIAQIAAVMDMVEEMGGTESAEDTEHAPPQRTEDYKPLLDNLTFLSLLHYDPTNRRYHLHDMVRHFVGWQGDATTRAAAEDLYVRYVLALAETIGLLYVQGGQQMTRALHLFESEWLHLRGMFEHLRGSDPDHPRDAERLLRLVERLNNVLVVRLPPATRLPWLQAWRGVAQQVDNRRSEGWALYELGAAYRLMSEYDTAHTHARQALDLARQQHDSPLEAWSVDELINLALVQGNEHDARAELEQSLQQQQAQGEVRTPTLMRLGELLRLMGEPEPAAQHLQQALQQAQQRGERYLEMNARTMLGDLAFQVEQPEQALRHYRAALTIAREPGDQNAMMRMYGSMGRTLARLGQRKQAQEHLQRALKMAQQGGYHLEHAQTLASLGSFYAGVGKVDRAIKHFEQALDLFKALQQQRDEAGVSFNLGHLYRVRGGYGDILEAHRHMARAVELAHTLDPPPFDVAQAEEYLDLLRAAVS